MPNATPALAKAALNRGDPFESALRLKEEATVPLTDTGRPALPISNRRPAGAAIPLAGIAASASNYLASLVSPFGMSFMLSSDFMVFFIF
jgi:hypothetical protein